MNEQNDFKKIIADRMQVIPKEVKDAILSVDYSNQLQEVVKRNRLLIDQAGKLEMETTLVLLGLEPLSDYTENLAKELGVPMSVAISIANDVNNLIFRNIRESLQKMNDQDLLEEETNQDIALKASSNVGRGDKMAFATPSRESVLSEIENPGRNAPSLSTPASLPVAQVQVATQTPSTPAITNILESKLQGTVSLPKQEIKIEDKSKLPPKNDPYREAIM